MATRKFHVRISSKDRVDRERKELQKQGYKVHVRTINRGKTKADKKSGLFKVWDIYKGK
jgi:hypothetical protein